jgi:hypothetical protein
MIRTINIYWNRLQSAALTIQHPKPKHSRLESTNIYSLTDYCSNPELLVENKFVNSTIEVIFTIIKK